MEKRPRILLIDDDIDFVETTKIVLSRDYEIITACNGDEGLRRAREANPDLILLDVIMPIKDGFTAAEQFKKDPQLNKIPVIMLTSFSTRGQGTGIPFSRGLTLEAEDYIEKPVAPAELLGAVRRHLRK